MATMGGKFAIPVATRRLVIEKLDGAPGAEACSAYRRFRPNSAPRSISSPATNGGLVNAPVNAIAYAGVVMRLSPRLALIPQRALHAQTRDDIWHVTADETEVLSFSRRNGKVLSGDL